MKPPFVFLILATTQVFGWGAVGFLPVLAPKIASDLHLTLPLAFSGLTVFFATMGIFAPWVGRAFVRFEVGNVMAAGACVLALGLLTISISHDIALYFVGWNILGTGGAMFLTTAAYAYLSEYDEHRARRTIAWLMLATGLAGSVFWPLTAEIEPLFGWRHVLQLYASIMIVAVVPLMAVGLPRVKAPTDKHRDIPTPARRNSTFWLLVSAIALNGFVTYGMEAVTIELFKSMGADTSWAIAIASSLGVLKVCGRLVDLAGGRRWDAVATGLVAGAMIIAGLVCLSVSGSAPTGLVFRVTLFGIGSGAFAVARATMPLVFFSRSDYAAAISVIALPMNLCSAIAAPALSGVLTSTGAASTLSMLALVSATSLSLLVVLNKGRVRALTASNGTGLGDRL